MARLLKIICNTLIVLAVAIAVALLLPPIMGVTTTIIDSQGIRSNLPVGSVTYSRKVTADNLQKGDLVLVESKNEAYEYSVVSVDVVTKKMVVKNAIDNAAEEKEMKITSGVSRVSFTIPFIGFAVIAMQTVEGMIVIGLIVLFIIILYVLSEVWKKKPEEEEAPVRKEKPKKEKVRALEPANAAADASKGSSGSKAAAGAAVAAAAGLAAAAGQAEESAAENAGNAAPQSSQEVSMDLTEEEFQRILAEAMAKNSANMEVGLDGWQPAEPKPETRPEAEITAVEAAETPESAEPVQRDVEGPDADENETKTAEASSGPEEKTSADGKEESGEKKTVPPRRRSLDEMLEYAKKGGGDPEFRKDDVSGLDVVDYSSFL